MPLYRYEDGTIQEAACWAHARRKFYDLYEACPSALSEALRRIGELKYEVVPLKAHTRHAARKTHQGRVRSLKANSPGPDSPAHINALAATLQ